MKQETDKKPAYRMCPWYAAAATTALILWWSFSAVDNLGIKLFPPSNDYQTPRQAYLQALYSVLKLSCFTGIFIVPISLFATGLTQGFWHDPSKRWYIRLLPLYLLLGAVMASVGMPFFFMLMAG